MQKKIQIIVNTADDKHLLNSIVLSEDSENSSNSSLEKSDYSL